MNLQAHNKNDKAQLLIQFPEKVSPLTFELILSKYYRKTFQKDIITIKYDLTDVVWMDIFELSITSLWMLALKAKGKIISVNLPANEVVRNFLTTYGFDRFIDTNKFEKQSTYETIVTRIATEIEGHPIYPLTFFYQTGFYQLLDDLDFRNRLEMIMADIGDAEIVKTGAIRNVVLKELIDNIRIHAKESYSNIIMTKFSKSSPEIGSSFESGFFNKLRGKAYASLVIADLGEGINKKLANVYATDEILPLSKPEPTDVDLLNYSFLSHSTSRSLEERIGEITDLLTLEEKSFPPDTGLFRLKEVAREFQGLLYVRNGSAIICYDFFSDPARKSPISNYEFKEWQKITDIGGTQFKLYFPLEIQKREVSLVRPRYRNNAIKRNYSYLPIQQYLKNNAKLSLKEEASVIQQFSNDLERLILADPTWTVIIDFENASTLSSKAVHFILFKAMQRQTENTSLIAVNISFYEKPSETLLSEINNKVRNLQPLCLISLTRVVDFFGLAEGELSSLLDLLNKDIKQTSDMIAIAEKFPKLFEFDPYKDRFEFSHSIEQINQYIKENRRLQIAQKVETDEIFKQNQRVLLPSKMYCEGYFEVRRLIENPFIVNNIVSWFAYWLFELKPDFIISVASQIGEVTDKTIELLYKETRKKIRHINIKTPVNNEELIGLMFELKRGDRGIIFTEVVGSAKTLRSILRHCQKGEIAGVFTLVDSIEVDSDEIEHNGKKIKVEAVFKHSLTYLPVLPPNWNYSDVSLVDKNTHFLIPPFRFDEPLWKLVNKSTITVENERVEVFSNGFFNDCIIPNNLYYEGHFFSDHNHLIYLFDIPKLVSKFGQEIRDLITEKVERIASQIDDPITHVIYLEKNPGVDFIAKQICKQFDRCIPYPISNEMFNSEFGESTITPHMKSVIIIDDALVSGETILRLYDLVERLGASFIFAFTLINRGSEYVLRKFKKITGYGNIKIQTGHLADARISNYPSNECPICLRREKLIKVNKEFDNEIFSGFVLNEINRMSPVSVSSAENVLRSRDLSINESLILRWKLELAKDEKLLAVRKELTTILKSYKKNFKPVLAIIRILHREQNSFVTDQKNRETIFYDSFIKELLESCWFFIENKDDLLPTEFEAVFFLLSVFDIDKFVNRLPDILKRTLNSPERFIRALVQLFLMDEVFISPGKLKRIFQKLDNSPNISGDIREVIEKVYFYWERKEQRLESWKINRIENFKVITSGILHEEEHIKEAMLHTLTSKQVDYNEVQTNWSVLHSEVSKIAPLVRGCTENHVSDTLADELYEHLQNLQDELDQGNVLIKDLAKLANTSISMNDLPVIKLRKVIESIDEIIKGDNGIESALDHLKTDIKTVIYRTLKSYGLDNKGINVEKEIPKHACLVFGEYARVNEIVGNIIKNVVKWSEATALKIRINIEKHFANISFIDNGIGIKDNYDDDSSLFDFGLKNIKNIAYQNCGDFKIIKIHKNSKHYKEGFRTHLLVKLPYFKVKE